MIIRDIKHVSFYTDACCQLTFLLLQYVLISRVVMVQIPSHYNFLCQFVTLVSLIVICNAHQITGDLNVASTALLQVLLRLRANLFEMEGALAAFPPAVPYVPLSMDAADGPKHGNRDHKSHNHGYSTYSGGYDSKNLVQQSESYGVYGSPQVYRLAFLDY